MNGSLYLRLAVVVALVAGTGTARGDVTVQGMTLDSDGTQVKIDQDKIWAVSLKSNTQFGEYVAPDGMGGYTLPLPDPHDDFIVRGLSKIGGMLKHARSGDLSQRFNANSNPVNLTFLPGPEYIKKYGKAEFKKHLESLLKILPKDHPDRKSLEEHLEELKKKGK